MIGAGQATERDGEALHALLRYDSPESLCARAVPYVREGLARGEAVMAVVSAGAEQVLSAALGEDVAGVGWQAEDVSYARLGVMFEGFRRFLGGQRAAGVPMRLLAELGCVHTLTHGELSPFQLCAARHADAALVGSVDAFSIAQLLEALRRIGVPRPGGQAVLEATDLEFIDVRALRDLDRHAADAGATLVLRSPPKFVLRLMELLGVRAVRAERPT